MLSRNDHKKFSLFLAYCLLLYAVIVACFSFSSCWSGVRSELIPHRNVLGSVSKGSQEAYLMLIHMLDDLEREHLERKVKAIGQPDLLEKFIQDYVTYRDLLKLLPKPERNGFSQEFSKAVDLNDQGRLIIQYLSKFKFFKHTGLQSQQNYKDLIELLPDNLAIALKSKVVNATTVDEVDHLIASQFRKLFKQLDDRVKEKLSTLPDHKRQEILKAAVSRDGKQSDLNIPTSIITKKIAIESTKLPVCYETTTTALHSNKALDINQLIEQKVKEQEKTLGDEVLQDSWGSKLPLQGDNRKDFLTLTLQFSPSDRKCLKQFFDEADPDSIEYISFVFYKSFNSDQRGKLLGSIIYLYKGWPVIAIKLCNNPKSLSWLEKFSLFSHLVGEQFDLFEKLNTCLQHLEACNYNYEQYEKTYCN